MAEDTDTLTLTAEIVASYLGANSHVKAEENPRADPLDPHGAVGEGRAQVGCD